MPMYYFHLRDDKFDVDGTEFVDASEARSHAIRVSRELMFNCCGWAAIGRMSVKDDDGNELFSFQDGSIWRPIVPQSNQRPSSPS
jgi:hypothetical protein